MKKIIKSFCITGIAIVNLIYALDGMKGVYCIAISILLTFYYLAKFSTIKKTKTICKN